MPAFGSPASAASATSQPELEPAPRRAGRSPRSVAPAASASRSVHSSSTAATARDHGPCSRAGEVDDETAVLAGHLGTDRHRELDRGAVRAVLARAAPVSAALGGEDPPSAQRRQVLQRDPRRARRRRRGRRRRRRARPSARTSPDGSSGPRRRRGPSGRRCERGRGTREAQSRVTGRGREVRPSRRPPRPRPSAARRSSGTRRPPRAARRACRRDRSRRPGPGGSAPPLDDDHPGLDLLAGEDLHAQPLRLRVAAVLR